MESNSFIFERALIGGLMKLGSNESQIACFVIDALKPANFYHMTYRSIFKVIYGLNKSNRYFDLLSVISAMKENEQVSALDIDQAYEFRADPSLMREYTKEIVNFSIERFAIGKIADLSDVISNKDNGTIQQRIGLAESVLNGLIEQMQAREERGLKDGRALANEWIDEIEAHHSGNSKTFDFGISGLDDIIKPKNIKAGSLIVVGARPKMGKTFFMTRMAEHYVVERDQAVCLFSMEMRGSDIWERVLSGYAKVNSDRFYTEGFDNNAFWDTLGHNNSELANKKIYVDDRAGNHIKNIKSEVRRIHRENKVGMIGVDYLTLMDGDDAERNDLKYGMITKELKKLAKELGCIVVLLTQLNRNLESRADKRPMPSDSRDTGQIEQDCDLWIGLYREAVYNENCGHQLTEAILRLNRAGASGTAFIQLKNGYFEDVSQVEANKILEECEKRNEQPTTEYRSKHRV